MAGGQGAHLGELSVGRRLLRRLLGVVELILCSLLGLLLVAHLVRVRVRGRGRVRVRVRVRVRIRVRVLPVAHLLLHLPLEVARTFRGRVGVRGRLRIRARVRAGVRAGVRIGGQGWVRVRVGVKVRSGRAPRSASLASCTLCASEGLAPLKGEVRVRVRFKGLGLG